MTGEGVESRKLLPTPFALERSETLMQQHVAFAVVLAREADGRFWTTIV
jgi:hypothetical protein